MSHATGFHAHCWEPVAHALNSQHHVVGLDHRGYGDAETVDPTTMTWDQYGLDALTAARHLYAQHNEPIVGIGHSMGGASLLMAAHAEPHLFKALFVFEPIVFPPHQTQMLVSALVAHFPLVQENDAVVSIFEAAIENFAAKPPMAAFNAVAREAYVRHGFKPTADGDIELKCLPEHEARTYETGGTSGAWDSLPPFQLLCGFCRAPSRHFNHQLLPSRLQREFQQVHMCVGMKSVISGRLKNQN